MLWEIDIYPRPGHPDRLALRLQRAARQLGFAGLEGVQAARGYLLQGKLEEQDVRRAVFELLADPIVEEPVLAPLGDRRLSQPRGDHSQVVHVLPRPGVMDPVAQSAERALVERGFAVEAARTFRKYWLPSLPPPDFHRLATRLLANEAIEEVIPGPLILSELACGRQYCFHLLTVPLSLMSVEELERLSREGQLYLAHEEMQAIQSHFRSLGREPTDAELETLAQTWSEHCSHKTLAGPIEYQQAGSEPRRYENLLRETIFAATQRVRQRLGEDDWCVSVFEDNAGIVRFDEEFNLVFKVETHNHPSALEPYGGANTGIGGVIRDSLGTGLGARPLCSTDVFCVAPLGVPLAELPEGVLHPVRVLEGVVEGVRDYGNRMGIPTVNGAVFFDPRYLGNPLVFCGNVGLIPRDKSHKEVRAGDLIVLLGGRTGRDGIHGATFSSAELTSQSESISSGAVQIGNAITEKTVVDVVLKARDRGLFSAITDCGAGGLSSAVGEMGAKLGAEVWLDRVPLKYRGLTYTEIWISEAQERMVLSVPGDHLLELEALCRSEAVEATVIGRFEPTGRLRLTYQEQVVADLCMQFLHSGRPRIVRQARYAAPAATALELPQKESWDYTGELLRILGSPNVASKEWIIRQYDHEVQGGTVIKPLVGPGRNGPGDAAVIRPVATRWRGVVLGCGMNPRFGDLDPAAMAASAIDEAMRNCVAVGADPRRIAILDNFCWGDTTRPETLGSLVRAAQACHDVAIELNVPFISGKDSLSNEYRYTDGSGRACSIAIPPSLLISALGQVDDVRRCVTMDLKEPGNLLYQVGITREELGGSHFALVEDLCGGQVPQLDPQVARSIFASLHRAITNGLVRSCHDLSEGGLAVALAEMAFAGGYGARAFLGQVPCDLAWKGSGLKQDEGKPASHRGNVEMHSLWGTRKATVVLLFSESNSRFVCEVAMERAEEFQRVMTGVPCALIGEVLADPVLQIVGLHGPSPTAGEEDYDPATLPLVVHAGLDELRRAWQTPQVL